MKQLFLSFVCIALSVPLFAQGHTDVTDEHTYAGVGSDTGIIDLHCHPSLKMYLFNDRLWKPHCNGPGINLFDMQIDTRSLNNHTVKGIIATHYLLEAGFVKYSLIRRIKVFINFFDPTLVAKVENEDYSNFAQINNMLDVMELEVRNANLKQDSVKLVIVNSFNEFEQTIKEGKIPVAHAIEGGHALGRNMVAPATKRHLQQEQKMAMAQHIKPGSYHEIKLSKAEQKLLKPDTLNRYKAYSKIKTPPYNTMTEQGQKPETNYIRNLDVLFKRGVCMMALSHFLPNDFTHPTEGVSADAKKSFHIEFYYNPDSDNVPLTYVGKKVVERMLQIGMIVDLTHTNPVSRHQIFLINDSLNRIRVSEGKLPRPVIFSHAGAQKVFDSGNEVPANKNYGLYDASDDEIDSIHACDGVIGVIPENFWLKGCDKAISPAECNCNKGIKFIMQTIDYIHARTHSYENIAIGSDFDGLADSPKDLYKPSQFGALIKAMRDEGINDTDISLMTHDNALRILRLGWGDYTPKNIR